jgi:ferredoxin-nitrate reductase
MKKTVCGYCGVGCKMTFDTDKLKGDKTYPVNEGKVCAKGSSELESVHTQNRLLHPQIRKSCSEVFTQASWDETLQYIAGKIESTKKEKVGIYLSGQLLTEDYYIANKLGKGFIGTNNVDTNSRTCMASAVVAYNKALGADFVPLRMDDIDKANLLILAGANTAEAHVILHNRIKKAKKSGLKVVVVDPRFTETAKIADIYLPLKIGSDIEFFNLISKRLIEENLYDKTFVEKYTNDFEVLKSGLESMDDDALLLATGLSGEKFEEFFDLYKQSENIVSAWTMGLNQASQGVDKNLALINTHLLSGKIFKEGNGPFSLTGQPNAMGGREVGGLSNMLAVHLGFEEDSIKKVSHFWKTENISNKPGFTATQMMEADLDVLIICHTDPVYHLPNRNKVEKHIQKIPTVVEINAYDNSETSAFAHIQLPAAPWGEKEGCQTNLDRTITKQEILFTPSGEAKADWQIFQLLAQKLGFQEAFDFQSSQEVFEEFQEMTKLNGHMDIAQASYETLRAKPFIWGEKIKHFLTPNKKANLFFVQNENLSEQVNDEYPFLLLTGRTRDQWHSGAKTLAPKVLLKYKALNYCEMHPNDAQRLELENGDEVTVSSIRGSVATNIFITDQVQEKTLFMPISNRNINYLTNDLLDSQSLEPDYNHNAVQIIKDT